MGGLIRLVFLLALIVGQVESSQAREIQVSLTENLSAMEVRISPGMGQMEPLSREFWDRADIISNGYRRRGQLVPDDPGKAVVYRVRLRHSSSQWGISQWHRPLRLTDWNDWLLTPVNWSMTRPFDLTIKVPEAVAAVLPFQFVSQAPGLFRYRAHPVLQDHGGMAAFGNLKVRKLSSGGDDFTVAVVGDDGAESDRLFQWAETVADIAIGLHGTPPGDAHIIIVPVPFVSGVVPWAHVRRGGGNHIIAYVREGADEKELVDDWTLFHEMMHLYHPYLRDEGRWVSEGFASYYQNVYRAHAGVVDGEHAWRRLKAGFERGRKENENNGNRPVTEGGRMRTYWTAAAMALEADLAIRQQTEGELDLAKVIGKFARRSLPAPRTWHPRDYMAALDDEIGEPILVPLYDRTVRDRFFPAPEVIEDDWKAIFTSEKS